MAFGSAPAPFLESVFRDDAERAEQRIFGDVWVPNLGTDSPE
jgi:hypothetical protein